MFMSGKILSLSLVIWCLSTGEFLKKMVASTKFVRSCMETLVSNLDVSVGIIMSMD